LEALTIVLQFDPVGGERDSLMLHLERTVIDPNRDRRIGKAPLPIELPILEAQKPVLVKVPRVAGQGLCVLNRTKERRQEASSLVG
jgi:hypothetical protein